MNLGWIVIGILFVGYTLFLCTKSNLNIGVVMPLFLGLPLLCYGVFYEAIQIFFLSPCGMILKWAIFLIYLAYSLLILVCSIFIVREMRSVAPKRADAVVVLGAGVQGKKLSLALKNRLDLAIHYLQENNETIIVVSGGKGMQEEVSEGSAMKAYLMEKGIEKERIYTEEKAKNTKENFRYSKNILDNLFPEKNYFIVFVTNSFHIFRSKIVAKNEGLNAYGIGCGAKWFMMPSYFMREALAIARYILF